MSWKVKLGVLLVIHIALASGLAYFALYAPPIQDGKSQGFWFAAVRVGLPGESVMAGGVYETQDEWYVYYVQGFHGQFLYRVPKTVALADFPTVVKRLEVAPKEDSQPYIVLAFQEWTRVDPSRSDADLLLKLVREFRLKHYQRNDADWRGDDTDWKMKFAQDQEAFEERYARIQRYWLNIVFEFVYLSFLVIFAAWPWLRSQSAIHWACHLAALPLLFFLPYYLGYVPYAYTSAGPVGGVLYPYLLVAFRASPVEWTSADKWIVQDLPHPLLELNQTTGPMLSLSGGGGMGPIGAVITGVFIGTAIVILRYAVPKLYLQYNSQHRSDGKAGDNVDMP